MKHIALKSYKLKKNGPQQSSVDTSTERLSGSTLTPTSGRLPPERRDRNPRRAANAAPTSRATHVDRGLTSKIPPLELQAQVWKVALRTINRFRVARAIDIAIACFAERSFEAAKTATARAMLKLSKAGYIRRYRTDRHHHVYGLTSAGADWLRDQNFEAKASIRAVADMTNPEHLLWMNFIVLSCEARGIEAMTESELMTSLNSGITKAQLKHAVQGLLKLSRKNKRDINLRPDAIAFEDDGITWFEIDRSQRGADREASLIELMRSVGKEVKNVARISPAYDRTLRRVVVHCYNDLIYNRNCSIARSAVAGADAPPLTEDAGNSHIRAIKIPKKNALDQDETQRYVKDTFEVWRAVYRPGITHQVDELVGYIIIQKLPVWLPKYRIDAPNAHSSEGWFTDNFLPYQRPESHGEWTAPRTEFRRL